jgi:hypothetical protein
MAWTAGRRSKGSRCCAPALQLVLGQGVEKRLIHASLQAAELAARAWIQGHQLGEGLPMTGQHDALTGRAPATGP